MATITPAADTSTGDESQPNLLADGLLYLGRFVASLRLTVVLFAAGIFIVLYGTLAQVEKDMWDVIAEYFRAKWSWIEIRLLFPPSLFPPTNPFFNALQSLPRYVGFPFLGGWTIGFLLAFNLLAAHLFRFKLQAKGSRLGLGLVVFAIAWGFIWMICGGTSQSSDGIQGLPVLKWSTLWQVIQVLLVVTWVASIVKLLQMDRGLRVAWYSMLAVCVTLGGLVLLCLLGGSAIRPADPSMRILWQLVQATIAGLILLVACVLLFKKRGGIVTIHLGVALVMFSELLVGLFAVEEQMQIAEGQTVNFARDLREIELAIVDSSEPDEDRVTVVPTDLLREDSVVKHADLPFDIQILKRYDNAILTEPANAKSSNLATAGLGLQLVAEPAAGARGTDGSGAVDVAAVYAKLLPKTGGDFSENTYLFSQQFGDGEILTTIRQDRPEAIRVGDKTYHVALRFKRTYKPYSIRLLDFNKTDYLGTSTARDFSAYIHIIDPSKDFDRDDIRIWMNNPLRFGGETFYQNSFTPADGVHAETTTLSIVTNMGWMIPYVACMVVFVGMGAHFFATLTRFSLRLYRSEPPDESTVEPTVKQKRRRENKQPDKVAQHWGIATFAIPTLMIALVALFALKPRNSIDEGMDLALFGRTPIVFEGRAKPIDTLARNALQRISNKQTLTDADGNRQPAILWLLDVISQAEDAEQHRVFRIENADVRQRLGLERRKGFRYALAEFRDKVFDGYAYNEDFANDIRRVREAAQEDALRLTTYQRKLLEFDQRLSQYRRLTNSFEPLPFPPTPTEEDFKKDPEAAQKTIERIRQMAVAVPQMDESLKQQKPPLVVPNFDDDTTDEQWQCYAAAFNRAFVIRHYFAKPIGEGVMLWIKILDAYAGDDTLEFNRLVTEYHDTLKAADLSNVDVDKVAFEASFNNMSPFGSAFVFYILALLVTAASWLFSSSATNRAAWWLIFATLLLHTFALGARIYISGRPPVTNLYSSAVFIGWGCVVFGLVFERIFPLGIGNLLSAVCGFSTLRIAALLAATGDDTFTVLQAVLDTQFWLSTHVVCVTLGYSATFVAGFLGIVAVFAHLVGFSQRTVNPAAASLEAVTSSASSAEKTETLGTTISRMIYGTLCFGLFLSFVGTVLGGLWADDSWGRFWGWDPKENGALIIVLWNALILHARWGKMIGNRGLAVLAIMGNITTAWSWFGVNQLDVGLHSYGQFSGNAVMFLGLFVFGNLVIAAVGLTPRIWKTAAV